MSYSKFPILTEESLEKLDKILFVTHLALGDFSYQQQFFKKFAQKYPHIKVDLWIDDVRRTRKFWKWKFIKNYVLYDWAKASSFFNKVYTKTYSHKVFKESLKEVQAEDYKVVVSLCTLRADKYGRIARKMSPRGYVVGMQDKYGCDVKCLDANITSSIFNRPKNSWHVTELYAQWFKELCNLEVDAEERKPVIVIPDDWIGYGAKYLKKAGIKEDRYTRHMFINPFAKDKKRCWPVENVYKLIEEFAKSPQFDDTCFIINAPPANYEEVKEVFGKAFEERVIFLEAKDNFFQLPSVMKMCDFVVTVETSIMHFACALGIPSVALMRTKNPEWTPYGKKEASIVFARDRNSWVKNIPVVEVFSRVNECCRFS